MTVRQLKAAYRLYREGLSVPKIADLIWEKMGYASSRSCQVCLYSAFKAYQLARGNPAEGRWRDHTCVRCGCPADMRTRGCDSCKNRHHSRKVRQHAAAV